MPTQAGSVPVFLLDEEAVARRLACTVKFLQKRRCVGGGPPYIKVGRLVRYRPEDLTRWIEARTMDSTSETL